LIQQLPEYIFLPSDGALHVTGLIAQPLRLTLDDLKNKYPRYTEHASFIDSDENREVQGAFTGVLVLDVLNSAKVSFDPRIKDDLLRFYISVTANDGYQSLLSWGEIAPDFGQQPVLIAYVVDGQSLEQLRLIVPGDRRGGRNVKAVVSLDVRHAPPISKVAP
jgi:DMSO/TMAO reductase YedYZ molybdopterin-dependent catalytic subunit